MKKFSECVSFGVCKIISKFLAYHTNSLKHLRRTVCMECILDCYAPKADNANSLFP